MQKPTRLDDVRSTANGIADAVRVLFAHLVETGTIKASDAPHVMEEMLTNLDPRVHDRWHGTLQDALAEVGSDGAPAQTPDR